MNKEQRGISLLLVVLLMLLAGCGIQQGAQPEGAKSGKPHLTVVDDGARTVQLPQMPQRVVVLSPALLELYYGVGGQAVGRPSSKLPPPQGAAAIPEVGFVYNVNMEQVLGLQPDLVIAEQGRHEKLVPLLEAAKVPVVLLRLRTLEDVHKQGDLFGRIAGSGGKATAALQDLQRRMDQITGKLPGEGPLVVILHASAKQVTVERESGVAGDIAKKLRVRNIAAASRPLEGDPDVTPYSLETLVAADPDLILVVTMGSGPEVKQRLQAEVENNPAWAGLKAVRAGRVEYLPSELFLSPPGIRYPEAMEYMARIAYPAVFGAGR